MATSLPEAVHRSQLAISKPNVALSGVTRTLAFTPVPEVEAWWWSCSTEIPQTYAVNDALKG